MYRWLRNTHLLLGLFCFLFLIMYGVSSVQMAHRAWFSVQPSVTTTHVTVPAEKVDGARTLALELMRQGAIGGEIMQIRTSADGYRFRAVRPGVAHDVSYSRQKGAAEIRTSTMNLLGVLNRLHHIGGVYHDYWLTNTWAAFLGFVAFALLIVGATGIYMWFKLREERLIGSLLLVLSLGFSLTIIVLIRTA